MKRCLFYFNTFLIVSLLFSPLFSAQAFDSTARYEYDPFVDGGGVPADFVKPSEGPGNPKITIRIPAAVFKAGVLDIYPIMADIFPKTACAYHVSFKNGKEDRHNGFVKLKVLNAYEAGGDEFDPTPDWFVIDGSFETNMDGAADAAADILFEANSFEECSLPVPATLVMRAHPPADAVSGGMISMPARPGVGGEGAAHGPMIGMPAGPGVGGDDGDGDDGADGGAGFRPVDGGHIGERPNRPVVFPGPIPGGDGDGDGDGEGPGEKPAGPVVPPLPEGGEKIGVTPVLPIMPAVQIPVSLKLPNFLEGGCSLGGVTGYSFADSGYGLVALLATIPLFGRRKK